MEELEQEFNDVEVEQTETVLTVFEQVENTYYYEKIYDDKHLGSFTESTELAYQLGWQDNTVAISDTEVSDLNGWTYLKGYAPKKSDKEKIEETKASKLKELSQLTDNIFNSQETYLTSSLGFRINARSKALEDINSLIVLNDEITYFNDFDDVIHKLNIDELKTLQKEIIKSGQYIYSQKWEYREKINNSETIEELNNIVFDFKYADFSK